jgi:hypothetical protein
MTEEFGSICDRGKLSYRRWDSPSLLIGHVVFFRGMKADGIMKPTTRFHPAPRLRMRGAVPLLLYIL